GDRVLVRMAKIDAVNVNSKASCADSYVRLRHYDLTYQADADTQQPRLKTVKLFGRDGTPEATTAIPMASYSYGTATNGGKLVYQRSTDSFAPGFTFPNTALSALPAHVPHRDTNIGFSTFANLLDVTGDGLPDVLTSTASNTLLIFSNWLQSASSRTLTDAEMTHGPLEIRSLNVPRYSFPANTNLVWRQAIDLMEMAVSISSMRRRRPGTGSCI
ncbi:MAG: hypothetical protein ACREBE_06605, partial [bacterium]